MKVLHVAQYIYDNKYEEFTKNKSGLGIMVRDICSSLSKYDEIFLLTHAITPGHKEGYTILKHTWPDVLRNLKLKNVIRGLKDFIVTNTTIRSKIRLLYYAINGGCLEYWIKEIAPDAIHVHEYTPAVQPFITLCLKKNLPLVVTCHGLLCEKDCEAYIKDTEKIIMREYENKKFILTVISSSIKDKLLKYYKNTGGGQIQVILNGVGAVKKQNAPSFLFNEQKRVHLLCVGQLSDRKNQIQIAKAVRLMEKDMLDQLEVLFVGNDTMNGYIQKQVAQMGLDDVITCVGFVDRDELYKYYDNADGLIMASKDEGFGLPVVEAMAYGVPSVMFQDVDAFSDLFSQDCMIPVADRSDHALKEAIIQLIDKKWDKEKIKKASERFSLEEMAKKYHLCYENIMRAG